MRPLLTRLPTVLLLAAALARPAPAAPPAEPDSQAPTRAAVALLRSPFLRERQEAARLLTGLLPGSRTAVLDAWKTGDEGLQAALCDVLEADGGEELVSLLVGAWCHGGDALAAAARQALVRDPVATRRGVAAYRSAHAAEDPGTRRRPLEAVDALLVRDEVERLFLSRKSRSGGTGVYRGQYEVLLPHRETALEVCLHLLKDEALRLPGTSAVGGYRFLRPVADVFDVWELRSMALFAITDLVLPSDRALIAELEAYLAKLRGQRESAPGDGNGDPERDAFFDDLLVTLYRVEPERHQEELDARLEDLDRKSYWPPIAHQAIAMRLRIGRYAEAVRGYEERLFDSLSRASDYYNLACAYAQWSLDPGRIPADRLRGRALDCLSRAVGEQWTDVSWMEQDRDLDPIRDTPEYRALVERIRQTIASDKPATPVPPPLRRPR